jgi:O-antigen ligase
MFGLLFSMFAPPCAGLLLAVPARRILYCIALAVMFIGLLSSVSSGPVMSGLIAILFILCYWWRKYWKIAAIAFLLMIVSVEVISNRHFYDVIGRFTFSPGTAWYRSRLLEVALGGGMSEHWLTGYGLVDPGWSVRIDGRDHTDIVNNYLLVLARFGLVGFVPFILILVSVIKNLSSAFKAARTESDRWLIWTLSSSLCGLLFAFFSVSLFAQTTTVFSILLGLCAVMEKVVAVPVVQYVPAEKSFRLQYSAY